MEGTSPRGCRGARGRYLLIGHGAMGTDHAGGNFEGGVAEDVALVIR